MLVGRIISSEKDRYLLAYSDEEGNDHFLPAQGRGVMRIKGHSPLVGDLVEFQPADQEGDGVIKRVLPRKNQLKRPPVANIDQVISLETIQEPKLSPLAMDKRLLSLEHRGLVILIVFNKIDRVDPADLKGWVDLYRGLGYPVFQISALTGQGIDGLKEWLEGKITALAGPSGVGKSSLVEYLTGKKLKTRELSKKTARGRQTTRRSSLYSIGHNSYLVDTPGFSSLELDDFKSLQEIGRCFPEIRSRSQACRFRDCSHRQEPACAVREALEKGEIAQSRYDSYLYFCKEFENRRPY